MNLSDKQVRNLLSHAQQLYPRFADKYCPDKKGGYLCIAGFVGPPILVAEIGDNPPDKKLGRWNVCQEKPARLARYAHELGHVSSWQTRDPANKKYGGAIWLPQYNCGLSFSGAPESLDETFVCLIARKEEVITLAEVDRIRKVSDNHFTLPALALLRAA